MARPMSTLTHLQERMLLQQRGEAPPSDFSLDPQSRDVLVNLPLDRIERDEEQPRKDLRAGIEDLKELLKQVGLIQPIVVCPVGPDRFLIVAGERRFTAARELGWETIAAIVRSRQDHSRLATQIIENLGRQELNPFEAAAGYQQLMVEFDFDQRALANYLRVSTATVNETLALNRLPEDVRQEGLRTSEPVRRSLLLEIAKIPDEDAQRELWRRAREGKLSVREVRRVRDGKDPSNSPISEPVVAAPWTFRQGGGTVTVHLDSTPSEGQLAELLRAALASLGPQAW